MSVWADNFTTQEQRSSNKDPNTRHKKLPFELMVKLFKRLPNHYKLLTLTLPPGAESKSLLLNTQCLAEVPELELI